MIGYDFRIRGLEVVLTQHNPDYLLKEEKKKGWVDGNYGYYVKVKIK